MQFKPLPFRSPVQDYERQAAEALEGWRSEDEGAIRLFRENHPRLLDDRIPWLPKRRSASELRAVTFDLDDARLALARWYTFQSWARLVDWVEAVAREGSPVSRFESAVEAVVGGDVATLANLLREHPERVRERSTRELRLALRWEP